MHVVYRNGSWQLAKDASSKHFGTKAAAVNTARQKLRKSSTAGELVVHGRDGRIQHIATPQRASEIKRDLRKAYAVH